MRPLGSCDRGGLLVWMCPCSASGALSPPPLAQIARLKHREFADLLFGLRVRTVSYRDFAVLQAHGFCGVGRLKSLANSKVPVGSQLIVIVKALVQHAVARFSACSRTCPARFIPNRQISRQTSPQMNRARTTINRLAHLVVATGTENRLSLRKFSLARAGCASGARSAASS